jgi:hypothetical protein
MSSFAENRTGQSRLALNLPWLGLGLTALLSLTPLLVEPLLSDRPLQLGFVAPYASAWAAWSSQFAVVLAMLLVLGLCVWASRATEPWVVLVCAVAAGLMTAWHWIDLDGKPLPAKWQVAMYLDILNHRASAPHQFRPLPYGFTRLLEWVTGNWYFSFVAYRWFFNFWFLWAWYRFARLWHSPKRSLVTLGLLVLLYPLSIRYYLGQLTDPLSHALFVLALLFIVEDRWLLLAVSLALGVLAKETVVLMVPAYWACWWRNGWTAFLRTAIIGVVCVGAFLAARLPFGWWPGYENINGTTCLMLWDNLGIGRQTYGHCMPLHIHYAHPAVFILIFLPFIAAGWRRLDVRLKALCLTLTPLLLLSSLLFSWIFESRNYIPLVPLLATSALLFFGRTGAQGREPAGFWRFARSRSLGQSNVKQGEPPVYSRGAK